MRFKDAKFITMDNNGYREVSLWEEKPFLYDRQEWICDYGKKILSFIDIHKSELPNGISELKPGECREILHISPKGHNVKIGEIV